MDMALGIGGLPKGRIIEIYGPEASGKTTVTLHVIAQVQKMGGTAAFIDAEQALDPVYASKTQPELDIPLPKIISNSACLNGGATLFFTTFTRVLLPIISEPSLT